MSVSGGSSATVTSTTDVEVCPNTKRTAFLQVDVCGWIGTSIRPRNHCRDITGEFPEIGGY